MNCSSITSSQYAVCCFENIANQHNTSFSLIAPILLSLTLTIAALATCLMTKKTKIEPYKETSPLLEKAIIKTTYSKSRALFLVLFPLIIPILSLTNLGLTIFDPYESNWATNGYDRCININCTSQLNNMNINNEICRLTDEQAKCVLSKYGDFYLNSIYTHNYSFKDSSEALNSCLVASSLLGFSLLLYYRKKFIAKQKSNLALKKTILCAYGIIMIMGISQLFLAALSTKNNNEIQGLWQHQIKGCCNF